MEKDNEFTFDNISQIEGLIKQCQTSANNFYTISLNDSLTSNQEKYTELAKDSAPINSRTKVKDQYGNSLAAIGTDDKVQSFTNYGFSNDTLNWTLWLALYNDSWVFRRAIDKPAQDQVNCGITLHGGEDFTKVYKTIDKFKNELTDLLRWGALFGGSIAVIMFEGLKEEDYSKPLDQKYIVGKRFKLYVTDRWYGCSVSTRTVNNMKDIDYGKPYYYDVTFANGRSWTVHHSYVLRYEHRTAPRLIKMGQLQGWGYAEGAHILNELSRDDQLKSSITTLVNKALIEVIKMKGMRGVFMGTDKGNMQQLTKRLEMVNWGRTYNSLTFLDKDDDYQEHGFANLGGLSDLLEKNMWLIAAALEMQGVLFGDLKGGLSQESDALRRYAITIKNRCDSYYRPVLNKFLKILFIVFDIKGSPDFDFNSLTKDEENKDKIAAIKDLSSMLDTLVNTGIISKYQYAQSIKNYINNDVIDLTITDEHLNKLKLEEEQSILDTIKEIGKKRPNQSFKEPEFNSPFRNMSAQRNPTPPVDYQQEEVEETNINVGENVNEQEQQESSPEDIEQR